MSFTKFHFSHSFTFLNICPVSYRIAQCFAWFLNDSTKNSILFNLKGDVHSKQIHYIPFSLHGKTGELMKYSWKQNRCFRNSKCANTDANALPLPFRLFYLHLYVSNAIVIWIMHTRSSKMYALNANKWIEWCPFGIPLQIFSGNWNVLCMN